MEYTLCYADGTREIEAADDAAAEAAALEIVGGVACDQWDADGWDDHEDAQNDAGQRAIAQLTTSGVARG